MLPLLAGNHARWSDPGKRTSLISSQSVRSKATSISEIQNFKNKNKISDCSVAERRYAQHN